MRFSVLFSSLLAISACGGGSGGKNTGTGGRGDATGSGGAVGTGGVGGAAGGGEDGQGLEGEMASDQCGAAVALSADGTRVVIGGPLNNGTGPNAGHARVFERSGNTWTQLGVDLDGEAAEDRFGGAVAINDAGTRVAIGSYLNDGGGTSSGHVRVFDYEGGAWTQVGADIDGTPNDGAGWAVAMSASGHRVIIGAPEAGGTPGQARIYEFTTGAWTQVGVNFPTGAELGHAVAMSDDGNRIAFSYPSAAGSSKPGFTQIHDWNGTEWTQVGVTIPGEAISDNFGVSLSLSADGSMIAIGADHNLGMEGGSTRAGHVRVFRLTAGTWTQVGADIDGPPGLAGGGGFGQSVSISADGTRLISAGDGGGKASIGIYNLSAETWTKAAVPDFGMGGRLGAVSISADGNTVAIGEVYFAGKAGSASGIVRLYDLR